MRRKTELACDCGRATHTYLSCGVPIPSQPEKRTKLEIHEEDAVLIHTALLREIASCASSDANRAAHCRRILLKIRSQWGEMKV